MPFFVTLTGYSGYVDQSARAEYLARKVLKKISEESFNPGQQTIAENTNFDAYVIVDWTLDFEGIFATYESKISSYNFNINCPHPEVISETLDFIEEEIKDTMYALYENSFEYNWQDESRIDINDAIRNDAINDLFSKVGYFV